MKVCIVTNYKLTANYGAILQAYALNAYIRSNDIECRTLDYAFKNDNIDMLKRLFFHPYALLNAVLVRLRRLPAARIVNVRKKEFEKFRNEYIPHTERYDQHTVGEIEKQFDLLICGSDQIWRPSLIDGKFDDVYWLKRFSDNIEKASYGASIGIDALNKRQSEYIRDAIKSYSAVSVREESARKLLEPFCTQKIQVVLDPVFLIERDKWLDFLACNAPEETDKYIFAYFIKPKKIIYRNIEKFSEQAGLKIVYMPYMAYTFNFCDFQLHGRKVLGAAPQEFLGLIKNAEYVFTDSFHATAFSIIFHKNFRTFITNHGSRLKNILSAADLKECIGSEKLPIGDLEVNEEKWKAADRHLKIMRQNSLDFLNHLLAEGSNGT